MIAVIDYGVGNLFSVEKALLALGADVRVTNEEGVLRQAQKIVLPGVGAFGDCMKNLEATGLIPVLMDMVESGYPLLGICVGLQILFEGSDESPGAAGLGVFSGQVKKIVAPGLKIPHMGWNSLRTEASTGVIDLFDGLGQGAYVYFVHSYHAAPTDPDIITARSEYGESITAAVAKDNVQAVQFHPEKSGDVGLRLLKNFIDG